MLARDSLKDLLNKSGYSRTDKLLLCLAVEDDLPKGVAAIRTLAVGAGLRAAKSWNISAILGASNGLAVRTDGGWELTADGRSKVISLAGGLAASAPTKVAVKLRAELSKLQDPVTRRFVAEAISCLEANLLRAAVVLSWVGALSVIYDHVISNHLVVFNTEAAKKDPKWKPAKTRDDLARLKEANFLVILESASIIGRSVKQELEGCLKLRNGSGHPNSLAVGEARAAAHVETLLLNVFSPFT